MAALIVANLVPLAGILVLGWNPWSVVFAYWGESAIVGFWTVVKMIGARTRRQEAFFCVPFFVAHFGLFMAVHGVFLLILAALAGAEFPSGGEGTAGDDILGLLTAFPRHGAFRDMLLVLVPLFVSHGIATVRTFFLSGRYLRETPGNQMKSPYGRIVVMQITILAGTVLAFALGGMTAGVLTPFIALKLVVDARALRAEEKRSHVVR